MNFRFSFQEIFYQYQLKQRLTHTLGLRPHKIKAVPFKTFAYVCFSCEEDREAALKAVNGHVWKGRELTAKKAQAAADPLKRKLESLKDETALENKKKRTDDNHFSDLPSALRLKSSVTPLWETPYSNQLEMKTETAKEVLKAVATHPDVRGSFVQARMLYNGLCSPLLPIVPSPVFQEYRNKSEFSIGRSEDGKETIVGFRFGLYKDGTDCVGSPSEILILPSSSKMVAQCFQEFLGSSTYPVFDHRTHEGHWRQLTVRTTRERGGIMGVAEFVVQNTTAEDREKVKEDIKNYFTEGPGKMSGVSTFYFRPCSIKTSNSTSEEPYELIYGDGFIYESLLEMKFRISPSSFFQVNTAAAEVMYKLIQEWTGATQTSTVLDICCGTGTIGLSLAKSVAKVIGIEMCKEAVEDAKSNAALNGVTNCEYYCAKVQDCIQDIVHNLDTSDVVAILDPPRAGIHQVVIKALRMCQQLKRIVYASCHPMIAKTNFIDLLRPASRKTKGVPFKFIKAQPIDMFPCTKHMELLMLLERDSDEVPSI
ncbi:tRNA (uracil-5-)-methyltransferase homolog A-like [Pomacea canaliculata]|uniref:tRNA (uracil-5-)-methyltransferase homolog A-like n=1 Tax=Pomacea canaliculata TaxID=400727 RepID=UPI000D73D8D8|nr:tRNA (uracil-5-)-methyltransferase homolog A-like [Pomacea canaliculata]